MGICQQRPLVSAKKQSRKRRTCRSVCPVHRSLLYPVLGGTRQYLFVRNKVQTRQASIKFSQAYISPAANGQAYEEMCPQVVWFTALCHPDMQDCARDLCSRTVMMAILDHSLDLTAPKSQRLSMQVLHRLVSCSHFRLQLAARITGWLAISALSTQIVLNSFFFFFCCRCSCSRAVTFLKGFNEDWSSVDFTLYKCHCIANCDRRCCAAQGQG